MMDIAPTPILDLISPRTATSIGDRDPGQKGATYSRRKHTPSQPTEDSEEKENGNGESGVQIDIRV